jgi:prolycopene isomerase
MKRMLVVLLSAGLILVGTGVIRAEGGGEETYDVVVIGAGGGGLATAARAAQAGMKVLLIEQHDKVGGYMTAFEQGDYTFEVSLHAVSGIGDEIGRNKPLFKDLGILGKVKPIKLQVPYRVVFPDLVMDVPADPDLYKARLQEKFPAEKDGIDHLFEMMSNIEFLLKASVGKGGQPPGENPGWPFAKYARMSAAEMLGEYIQDEKLLAVFSWLRAYCGTSLDELPATLFLGMWASYHYDGYYYVAGGSQAISNALAEVIKQNGGRILLDTMAIRIIVKNGRAVAVQTEDRKEHKARYVVSNASAPATINKLTGREHFPAEYLAKLDGMKIGPSILQLFLGVNHDYRPVFDGAHTISVFETSDYRQEIRWWEEGNVDKLSYLMVNYSVTEPGVAPTGKNVIVFTTYMPYDWQSGWHEAESYEKYEALKEKVARTLIRRAEKVLPELGSHVEVMEVGSPRTMEHYTLNPKGAVYGWAVDMNHSGPGRLDQQTPIPNLLLAGAWTRPGHGQIGVLTSGKDAAEKIIQMDEKTETTEGTGAHSED